LQFVQSQWPQWLFVHFSAHAQKGETVKIAWIDPLSGLMAPVGNNQLKSFQFFAEKYSN
jgi:branched-chain amino acid transport system substrate-binding protein